MPDPTLAGTTLDRCFHICSFFSDRDEEYRVLNEFYQEGLDRGEKALHIVNPDLRADHRARLAAAGIHVTLCEMSGQLDVVSWQEAYLRTGAFDSDQMLDTVERVLTACLETGYPRIRIMGNMASPLLRYMDSEQLLEYEAQVHDLLTRSRQPAVCVYDAANLSGEMMMGVLRTHPLILVGGIVRENPLFTPPDELLAEVLERRTPVCEWRQAG